MHRSRTLLTLMLAYGGASLLHFVHNAVYIRDYPNLPEWLTPLGVYASWCAIASVGVLGYVLYTRVSRVAGFVGIATFAVLGFGGLDHYAIASFSAHTVMMNATILLEVVAATGLLVFAVRDFIASRYVPSADAISRARPGPR